MKYKLYEVGGRIRDYYLGLESKDVDYSVVFENPSDFSTPIDAFTTLAEDLRTKGFDIFELKVDTLTIKARFPKDHRHSGTADFVIARKELYYKKGTRQPVVELGTLMDDLERRDFTVNAMARAEDGTIIDPFGGQRDILDRILRTPSDAFKSFHNDPLRLVRALRFMVTKEFGVSDTIINAIRSFDSNKMKVVSSERIQKELHHMFQHDTKSSLRILRWIYLINAGLYEKLLDGDLWLKPTNKKR